MRPDVFTRFLADQGVRRVACVPDSVLRGVIDQLEADPGMQLCTMNREDELVGWAAGVHLAGQRCLVMLQNSGLGNLLDSLISLPMTYRMPLVMLVCWRGYEKTDEVQHWLWGELQNPILDAVGVPYVVLPPDDEKILVETARAFEQAEARRGPVALLLRRGGIIDEQA